MDRLSVETLAHRYASADVTFPVFSTLVAGSPKALLSRMRRSSTFPAPTSSAKPATYRLGDLVSWWLREIADDSTGTSRASRTADPGADETLALPLQRWALRYSIQMCAHRHGVEETRLLVAGLGVARCDPVIADRLVGFDSEADGVHADRLLDELRRLCRSAADENSGASGEQHPGHNPGLVDALLAGRYPTDGLAPSPRRGVDRHRSGVGSSAESGAVVREVWGLWRHLGGVAGQAQFCEEIDDALAQLSTKSLKISRSSQGDLSALLVALAAIRPGHRVLDPACGEGTTLIEAAAATASRSGEQRIELIGRDTDKQAWAVCKARLTMRGLRHDLGAPGDAGDSLLGALEGLIVDRVVTEPGAGMWAAGRWLERSWMVLAPQGVAVVALPLLTFGRGLTKEGSARDAGARRRDSHREQAAANGHLGGLVVTPTNVRPETAEPLAVWVLAAQRPESVLCVDMTGGGTRGRLNSVQIKTAGRLFRLHRTGRDIAEVTLPPSVTAAVVPAAQIQASGDYWPGTWTLPDDASDDVERLKKETLPLVEVLRALVDRDAPVPDHLPAGITTSDLGQLDPVATDEIRRALTRLDNILANRSTRGRPPKADARRKR